MKLTNDDILEMIKSLREMALNCEQMSKTLADACISSDWLKTAKNTMNFEAEYLEKYLL